MKTYALYLLMLCFSVMGCQKDIGESDAELAAKNDKDGKYNKERYLPVMIVDSSLDNSLVDTIRISYHDNNGNISCVTSSRRNGVIKFHYNSDNELHRVDYYDKGYYLITNKEGKLAKCSFFRTNRPSIPYFDLIFNSTENDTIVVLERFYDATEFRPRYFLYEDINNAKALARSYKDDAGWGYYYDFISNDKNYWAKDVKSKELLSYISISELMDIFPTKNNIISIQQVDFVLDKRASYSEIQYNDANYPIFLKSSMVATLDASGPQYYNDQRKIYYQKIVSN